MKKLFLSILTITMVSFLSLGCVTQQMWKKDGPTYSNIPYNETIISFYINNNTSQIAFMGTKYHYILKDYNQRFAEVMEAKKFLKLSQENLKINTKTSKTRPRVNIQVSVEFPIDSLSAKQIIWLKNHAFKALLLPITIEEPLGMVPLPHKGKIIGYVKKFHLDGKRYFANKEVNHRLEKLDKPLILQIDESVMDDAPSVIVEGLKVPLKIVATPFTLVADGLMLLGFAFIPFKI